MSLLVIMTAGALCASVEEWIERMVERSRRPRMLRGGRYRFN